MSQASDIKNDRRYTKDHEWALAKGGSITVGITAFAVDQLGDVTLINWDVAPGDRVEAGQVFGTIESVKTLSDLFAPVTGTVEKINAELESAPERVNEDCWDKGWMVVIAPEDPKAFETLMDAKSYGDHIATLEH
jgi:glycine cleavage system H protein